MKAVLTSSLIVLSLSLPGLAQQPTGGNTATQERVAALKQALAANQAALRQYTWTESTEISLKGEVKKREQKVCRYGSDGKVQKTPLQAEEPKQQAQQSHGGRRRGGRVKEAVVEKKVGEVKDYMERVASLVHEYVPPDKEKVQAAASAGHVSMKPDSAAGTAALGIQDYLKPGDALSVGLDLKANALTSCDVHSYVDDPKDDAVTLAVHFDRLPDGTSYPQQVLLDVAAKKIQVKVTNSGYTKLSQ